MTSKENPTPAECQAELDRRPRGAWFDDFEDASIDTIEQGPASVVADSGRADVATFRSDEVPD